VGESVSFKDDSNMDSLLRLGVPQGEHMGRGMLGMVARLTCDGLGVLHCTAAAEDTGVCNAGSRLGARGDSPWSDRVLCRQRFASCGTCRTNKEPLLVMLRSYMTASSTRTPCYSGLVQLGWQGVQPAGCGLLGGVVVVLCGPGV
jgi:hypothetical protein